MQVDKSGSSVTPMKYVARLTWVIFAALSLIFFFAAFASLISDLYASLASQQRLKSGTSQYSLKASEFSTRVAPWKAQAWFEYASNASMHSEIKPEIIIDAASRAVYWAHADAGTWLLLARVLAIQGQFDTLMVNAMQRAVSLAPNAPNYRKQLALDGVFWWYQGDDQMHRIWRESMKMTISAHPDSLAYIVAVRREGSFCEGPGRQLKLTQWCDWVIKTRAGCDAVDLTTGQRMYCEYHGFNHAKAHEEK